MLLYLLRHGIAEPATPDLPDANRALTPKGVKRLQAVLGRARSAGVKPSLILTSPLRRAKETAAVAAKELHYTGPLGETRAIAPEATPEALWNEVRAHKDCEELLIVGHEPLFSSAYAHLLNCPTLQVKVKKGSLGCIELGTFGRQPGGVLRWLATPDI